MRVDLCKRGWSAGGIDYMRSSNLLRVWDRIEAAVNH
jgi:hypothetical protein